MFKLIQIHQEENLIEPNQLILDIGAAPGSWSEFISKNFPTKIIAVDLLEMKNLPNITFIKGDFSQSQVLSQIIKSANNEKFDLILSDASPNLSGNKLRDQANSSRILHKVLEFSKSHLKNHGTLLCKAFQGSEFPDLKSEFKNIFGKVKIKKPKASRPQSKEIYLLCKNLRSSRDGLPLNSGQVD